jgi:hypothetical protein
MMQKLAYKARLTVYEKNYSSSPIHIIWVIAPHQRDSIDLIALRLTWVHHGPMANGLRNMGYSIKQLS